VIDLGHCKAKRGKPALLLQQQGKFSLHGVKLALGQSDLVLAIARRHDARRIFRLPTERHHVGGDPAHRTHEQIMQGKINQRGGDRGYEQRQQQDIGGKAQHGLAQRRFLDHDFHEFSAHRRGTNRADQVATAAKKNGLERADDRLRR